MRSGRELDTQIAQEVFGLEVKLKAKKLWEVTPQGDRPLRRYSGEMEAAWHVAEKMNISMIPVENGNWFAFAGGSERWKSPADFIQALQSGNFVQAGAAVGDKPALTICIAAIKALQNQKAAEAVKQTPSREGVEANAIH